jgi:DNA mismatch repair protein MutL
MNPETLHDEQCAPRPDRTTGGLTMAHVQILPSDLINQIAAGEVVERPASVVKELVENAIDAGALHIDLILENGGRKRIEVRDDGSGMAAGDALLAMQRHATSKLTSFHDLVHVRTLGFRGEALPSIASVSRFSILTYDGRSEHAIEIEHDPLTASTSERPAARDRGTTVSVRELFENVPARRKFLKSADAEFRSIIAVVTAYALASPHRSFRVEHNGRPVLDLPTAASLRDRVVAVLGDDLGPQLAELEGETDGIAVRGFVTRGVRFGSRRNQFFFVNGRLVKDRVLTHAVHRASEAFDSEGFPGIALFVDLEPERVDVNVHPAKTEVRFRDSGVIHVLVEHAIKRALGGAEEGGALLGASAADILAESPFPPGAAAVGSSGDGPLATRADQRSFIPPALSPSYQPAALPLFREGSALVQPPRNQASVMEPTPSPDLGDLRGRIIGQYRMSYILLDTPGGLRLVDQHVAHERVLYDRFFASTAGTAVDSQRLLHPHLYETGAAEGAALESHLDELRLIGFEMERFSGNTFAITAIPSQLLRHDVEGFFRKLLDASLEERTPHLARVREKVCASLACQAAIKVHRQLGGDEMASVVAGLLDSSNPFACPHGRPIIVDIRHLDIEKHFHRK